MQGKKKCYSEEEEKKDPETGQGFFRGEEPLSEPRRKPSTGP